MLPAFATASLIWSAVLGDQGGQLGDRDDQGQGEEEQQQVGGDQHQDRRDPSRNPAMPFEPDPDRMQGDRDDQGEKHRPDDFGDGLRGGQCDRESRDADQSGQGERSTRAFRTVTRIEVVVIGTPVDGFSSLAA